MTPDLKELEQSTETIVLNALNRAYQLGQTYWQQADSESYSQNAKSDVTAEKFRQLRDETRISVCGLEVENFTLRSGTGHLGELIDELRADLVAENTRLKGEQAVLIRLFREGLNVLETLVGDSTDEQESLDALTEKMNNAINDVEYRHE